ncbi:MAG: methanogenesis marker 2 protein [Methanomassiliicoccales archaeon]|nr:methanogenesis marker 2 protein [Methanomassiliicoccales archaeon]
MDLYGLVESLRNFPGVTRKKSISSVINFFPKQAYTKVIASYGEDAAVVEQDDKWLLLAADGIMPSLMRANPFFAGYYAVLVNIHDISAMGGVPIAMLDILSVKDNRICSQVMKGMEAAVKKYGVPIVGGHTHPDCDYDAIDVAIIGITEKGQAIFSHTAQARDDVIVGMDLDGFYPEALPFAWDTTSKKEAPILRRQMMIMNKIAKQGLVRSGKDISNPGTLGTLGMLLETSGKGAVVNVDDIPCPKNVDLAQWLKSYQGCGYVITCDPVNSQKVMEMYASVGVTSAVIGKVTDDRKLIIRKDDQSAVMFDFDKEIITGCKPQSTVGWESVEMGK